MIYKTVETDMKTPKLRQGEKHARFGANYTENDLKTCVTDMKSPTLRQGETHARVRANYNEDDLQDTYDRHEDTNTEKG
jgi:hypothetical protein